MMQVTKTWAAQDALVTLVDGISQLSAWTVEFGLPYDRRDQHIWVDEEVVDWTRSDQTSNFAAQEEAFTLSVFLYSRRIGATAKEQRDEVATAAAYIEAAIAADPTLSALLMSARVVGGEFETAWIDAEATYRVGVLRLDIRCTAWLA